MEALAWWSYRALRTRLGRAEGGACAVRNTMLAGVSKAGAASPGGVSGAQPTQLSTSATDIPLLYMEIAEGSVTWRRVRTTRY